MSKLIDSVGKCLIVAVITIQNGCSPLQVTNCLESSPLSELTSQTNQVLENPDIKEFYHHYFPRGKLEFSYEGKTKRTQTRTFLQPNINLGNELDYTINLGIETKY